MVTKDEIKKILEEYVYGYTCKKCGGGGMIDGEDCHACKTLGIVDWQYDLAVDKIMDIITPSPHDGKEQGK